MKNCSNEIRSNEIGIRRGSSASANINSYFGLIATHSITHSKLRDGMNLVAKEFVACQSDENPGVLILSPFAGAGGLMHEAIMANPYETHITAAGKTLV